MMRAGDIPPYKRVCLRSDEDLARLPVLLTACLDYRKAASKIKELTIDANGPKLYSGFAEQATQSPSQDKDTLVRCIESLPLSQEVMQEVVEIVLQKKRGYLRNSVMSPLYEKLLADNEYTRLECMYAISAVLLALAGNIETLRLQQPNWGSPLCSFLRFNNNSIESPPQYLHSLKHLHLAPKYDHIHSDERFYVQFDIFEMLRYFHRLPSIESITFDGVTDHFNGGEVSSAIPPHICPNLKSISATHSSLDSLTLSALIRLPKPNTLEVFRATLGGRSELGGHPFVFSKTLGKALETQRLSLHTLELDLGAHCCSGTLTSQHPDNHGPCEDETQMSYEGREMHDEDLADAREDLDFLRDERDSTGPYYAFDLPESKPYGATIGSLHDFRNLESLTIATKLLLGPVDVEFPPAPPFRLVDALPSSLRSFTLLDYERGKVASHDDTVDEFVRLRAQTLPGLVDVVGIDTTVVGGRSVRRPDENRELLWKGVQWDGSWEVAERDPDEDDDL